MADIGNLVVENNMLKQKKDEIERDRERILNSYSYRLGLIITWIPRKIRRCISIRKENK